MTEAIRIAVPLPVFETPRLTLRSITAHDAEGLLGFIEEGTLRDWLCVAGEFRSVVMYSLLRTEWMQQRSRPC